MVASQCKDEIIFQMKHTLRSVEHHVIIRNLSDTTLEVGGNLVVLDAVLDIRLDPILHVIVHLSTTINQRHTGTVTPKLQSRNGCRILAADDENIAVVVRVGLAI